MYKIEDHPIIKTATECGLSNEKHSWGNFRNGTKSEIREIMKKSITEHVKQGEIFFVNDLRMFVRRYFILTLDYEDSFTSEALFMSKSLLTQEYIPLNHTISFTTFLGSCQKKRFTHHAPIYLGKSGLNPLHTQKLYFNKQVDLQKLFDEHYDESKNTLFLKPTLEERMNVIFPSLAD